MSNEFKKEAEKESTASINKANSKSIVGVAQSINDLREKEFSGEKLCKKEKLSLIAFDKYRIDVLNRQESEEAFHKKYLELQAMANLTPFEEFLKEEYRVL